MTTKKDKINKQDTSASNGGSSSPLEQPECFVIMPISDPDGYTAGHFGQVFDDLFMSACERAGYRAIRADQVRQTNLIHLDVLQRIIESPMAICDLSSRNPNVLFELGLRQAFDKPVVLVQEIGTPTIFDITPLRYTEYHREMLYRQVIEDQEKITAAILATKEAISNSKSINSIVKLLSLTSSASLTNVSEGEKESALLQLIMSELGNLRKEISESRRNNEETLGARMGGRRNSRGWVDNEIRSISEEAFSLGNLIASAGSDEREIFSEDINSLWIRLIHLIDYVIASKLNDEKTVVTLNKLQRYLFDLMKTDSQKIERVPTPNEKETQT